MLVSDTFDREDSTTIGPADTYGGLWEEVSGDWWISSNQLYESGTSNAILVNATVNPFGARGVVNANIYPVGGEKYRLLIDYQNSSTYKWVEFETQTTYLKITAGSETRTYTTADSTWDITVRPMTISAILDDGFLCGYCRDISFSGCVWDNGASPGAGDRAGVANGGTMEIYMDNFEFFEHNHDNPNCSDYGCYCLDGNGDRYYPAWKMHLDFYDDDCCDGLDTAWADLEYDCNADRWVCVDGLIGGVAWPEPGLSGEPTPYVTCGGDDGCTYYLTMLACADGPVIELPCHIDPVPGGAYGYGMPTTDFTCSPFQARWDFVVSNWMFQCSDTFCTPSEGVDCHYHIIMNEM